MTERILAENELLKRKLEAVKKWYAKAEANGWNFSVLKKILEAED